VPDWKQHTETMAVEEHGNQKLIELSLYPKSVYTFVIQGVLR
jgi:hypothetical protein